MEGKHWQKLQKGGLFVSLLLIGARLFSVMFLSVIVSKINISLLLNTVLHKKNYQNHISLDVHYKSIIQLLSNELLTSFIDRALLPFRRTIKPIIEGGLIGHIEQNTG